MNHEYLILVEIVRETDDSIHVVNHKGIHPTMESARKYVKECWPQHVEHDHCIEFGEGNEEVCMTAQFRILPFYPEQADG